MSDAPAAKRPRPDEEEGAAAGGAGAGSIESPAGLTPLPDEPHADAVGAVELWSYWRSSCSYRVRIALNLKGLAFTTYHAVHLVKEGGKQFAPEYTTLNPSKAVPTLKIDGHVLTQSQAIIEYLEDTRPEPELLPRAAADRAAVRALVCIISNDTQPLGNLRVLKHVQSFYGSQAEKEAGRDEWARKYMAIGFDAFEAALAKTAGKFCFGDAITMADVFLVPQVYNAIRFKLDMTPYPTIARIAAALEAHPAFVAAHPSKQPDAE